ncbi:hypothetical protein FANTH_3799 [Fusarium anthophilum]|uniref:Uncharacterized protein n=1 Tax=Fusarium anthophilum TaxID=48485 RepID=A0A8H4ZQR1_9HYPO|nr:hypothetical protein FANTH_3799 [Fusarium anthophilum]
MYISDQPIASLPPSYGTPQFALERPSGRQAESHINAELKTNNEPRSLPRRQLINRYWKVVFTLIIILFIFTPTRPISPPKLDEGTMLQMAHRMNNLAVQCPKDLPLHIQHNPPPNQ